MDQYLTKFKVFGSIFKVFWGQNLTKFQVFGSKFQVFGGQNLTKFKVFGSIFKVFGGQNLWFFKGFGGQIYGFLSVFQMFWDRNFRFLACLRFRVLGG